MGALETRGRIALGRSRMERVEGRTLLVIGAPQHDASAYHLSGFLAPDPVICLRVGGGEAGGKKYLVRDRKSTRLNSSHANISYAVFCLKKKKNTSCIPRH